MGGPTAAKIKDLVAGSSWACPRPTPQGEPGTAARSRDFSLGRRRISTAASGPTAAPPSRGRGLGVARPHRGRAYLGLCRGDPRPPRPAANSPAVAPATAAACSASRGGGAANHGHGRRGAYWEEKRELWEFRGQTFLGRK